MYDLYWVFVPLALITGLLVSWLFRDRPWANLIWVPTMVFTALPALFLVGQIFWILGMRGPDAGWGVISLVIYGPVVLVCLAALAIGYRIRPRAPARRIPYLLAGMAVTAAIAGIVNWQTQAKIELRITGADGKPLSKVRCGSNDTLSDPEGIMRFKVRKGQLSTRSLDSGSSVVTLRFIPLRQTPGMMEVEQSWTRPLADGTLVESYAEQVPTEGLVRITIAMTPSGSLDPSARLPYIRAAKDKILSRADPTVDLGNVCRNLESIELIPELVETYRKSPGARPSIRRGLLEIARRLTELNEACGGGKGTAAAFRTTEYAGLVELCKWAGVSQGPSPEDSLARVRGAIARKADPVLELILEMLPGDKDLFTLLGRFKDLANPLAPRLVTKLLETPPADRNEANVWSDAFSSIRATKSQVGPLLQADNELLKHIASRARDR